MLFTGEFGSDNPTITFTTDYRHHDGGNEKLYGSGAKAGRKFLIYFASIVQFGYITLLISAPSRDTVLPLTTRQT
jgi:hypothetical protein